MLSDETIVPSSCSSPVPTSTSPSSYLLPFDAVTATPRRHQSRFLTNCKRDRIATISPIALLPRMNAYAVARSCRIIRAIDTNKYQRRHCQYHHVRRPTYDACQRQSGHSTICNCGFGLGLCSHVRRRTGSIAAEQSSSSLSYSQPLTDSTNINTTQALPSTWHSINSISQRCSQFDHQLSPMLVEAALAMPTRAQCCSQPMHSSTHRC